MPGRIAKGPQRRARSTGRKRAAPTHADATPSGTLSQRVLEQIHVLLRAQTGSDFSRYKKTYVQRGIERRMELHELDSAAHYSDLLSGNPGEIAGLYRELLIGVTSFFRDPESWEVLRRDALPELLAARSGMLRAWVPGCSTGEEAYSLAMAVAEAGGRESPQKLALQLFATDLDREALDRARRGVYPATIAADVSAERLRRFFVRRQDGFRVRKQLRDAVVFAPQNLIMDPPFAGLDLISCRNLLIYLSRELQRTLVPLFHQSLKPGGLLFLGRAETIGVFSGLFAPLDSKLPLYRRLEPPALHFEPRRL